MFPLRLNTREKQQICTVFDRFKANICGRSPVINRSKLQNPTLKQGRIHKYWREGCSGVLLPRAACDARPREDWFLEPCSNNLCTTLMYQAHTLEVLCSFASQADSLKKCGPYLHGVAKVCGNDVLHVHRMNPTEPELCTTVQNSMRPTFELSCRSLVEVFHPQMMIVCGCKHSQHCSTRPSHW